MQSADNENWTSILKPKSKWFELNLRELLHYKDLILLFVRRDFVAYYKQTILGPLWFLIQPLFTTIVFTVIFGKIANIPTDGLPKILFYLSGLVCWNYFADCLNKTSNTFVNNAGIFGKVYFPRLVIPLSVVLTNLITFCIQFLLFIVFLVYFYSKGVTVHFGYSIFLMPLLLLQMAMLGLGMGIIVSSMTTKYRDLNFAVGFGVQLWMYATPIVYPLSSVPEKLRWIYFFNPMSSIIENFRHAFLGVGSINAEQYFFSFGMTVLILMIGIVLFSRVEKNFMDTV